MPDYQDMEYVPDLERIEEDEALLAQIEAAKQQEQQELAAETGATPTPTPEPTSGEVREGWEPGGLFNAPTNDAEWALHNEKVQEESDYLAQNIVTGVGDTFLGVAELAEKAILHGQEGPIAGLKNKYEETFPTQTPLRKLAGLVLPMLWGGGIVQAKLKGSAFIQQLPRWKQIAASTAAEIGVEATVLAGSTSATDDNMIKMFNDTFGTNLIGATSDKYHPSFNYALNVLEGATITTGIGVLEVFAFLRSLRLGKPSVEVVANTPEAAEIIARNADIDLDAGANPYDIYEGKRIAALDEEAANRLVKIDGENIADLPYTRDITGVQRPVQNLNVDKVRAVVDNARIKLDPTVGAGVRPSVLSNNEVRAVVNATPEEHSDILGEVAEQMFPDVDAVLSDGTVIKQAQLRAEVDNVVFEAFNSDPKEFAANVNAMKSMLLGTEKFLTPEQFLVLGESFRRTFDLALSPDKIRAGAFVAKQAADNISTASVAAALVDEVSDTTPQLVNVFENLRLLSGEVERHKFAKKFGLERIRTLKMVRDPETAQEVSERLIQLNKEYTEGVGKAINEGRAITDNLREIAEANPRYLKPFRDLFLEAGNDVNNLYTMNRWLQNKLGVMKKAIIDGNPEVPSLIIQGMRSAMYNSVLLGASLPKSVMGNAILTAAKPISAVLGAGRGALLMNGADAADFRRSIAVYSGVKENFYRGLDLMRRRWKHINENPLLAQKGGRADLRTARSEELDKINDFKEAWLAEGKPFDGRVAAANTALLLGWYNDNRIVRSGVNALHAIDGFFSAFQGTGIARARAYDEIFQYSNGALNKEYFDKRSAELFDSYFDPVSGLPTDEAVKHATSEMSLNLPNFLVDRLEGFLDAVPAAQPTFMFARTGMNAFDVSWSFMPTSGLGLGIGRARKLLAAGSQAEKAAALAEHGLEYSETMWRAKKNEYIGRTIAGQSIVMGATLWALDGNLYGPGPTDAGERQRMMRVMGGNYFNHIKNPFTGEWHDYRGMEPFSMLLGLVGSAVNEAQRTDQAVMEDLYRKTAHAITMNVTNQTFFKQFEPLAALLGKDPTAWSRFAANAANMIVPLSGLRGIVNNTFAPQLKDVERDLGSMIANRMFKIANTLEDEIDIYTGQPINYVNPINAGINALLPFFKSNGGMEPWRQWLVETGWDGGSRIRKNPDTGIEYSPWDRQWIHRFIAQHMNLAGQIQALSENPELNAEMKEYKRQLDAGQYSQAEFPVEHTKVYKQLDLIHDRAFRLAHLAWVHKNLQNTRSGALKNQVQNQILYGDMKGAAESAEALRKQNKEVKELIKMNK